MWSYKACQIDLKANETADQVTPLTSSSNNVNGCNGNSWKQSSLSYTPLYNGIMYFQILELKKTLI